MRTDQYYNNLIKRIIDLSESNVWEIAVTEWQIIDCEVDDSQTESCVCGKEHLRYLYTIKTKQQISCDSVRKPCIYKKSQY